jgi:hypothetical protein
VPIGKNRASEKPGSEKPELRKSRARPERLVSDLPAQPLDEVRAEFPENLSPTVVMRRRAPGNARTAKAEPDGKFLYY